MYQIFLYSFIGPSGPEVFLILFILLLLFGVKDTPKIMRNISDLLIKFRHTANEFKHDLMYSDMRSEADEREKLENSSYNINENDNLKESNSDNNTINAKKN
tara:strand:- start:499 stop:804 length:306 start_codon:yes stop_codon:yes gene_type:complete